MSGDGQKTNMRQQVCDAARDLLSTKSTVTITGWMLKNAITLSLSSVFLGRGIQVVQEGTGDTGAPVDTEGNTVNTGKLYNLLLSMVTFTALLCVSAGTSQIVTNQTHIPPKLKKIYCAGLALFPAWAWKDVVSNFVTAATDLLVEKFSAARPGLLFNASLALLVVLISVSIQIYAEAWINKRDDEEAQATLAYKVLSALKQSFGLGVGFAVNNIFKAFFAEQWSKLWFQVVYVPIISLAIPPLQRSMKTKADDRREQWSTRTTKAVNIAIVAGNFVVGWAWKGLLDALLQDVQSQIQESLIITILGIATVLGVTWLEVPSTVRDVSTLTAGMNIGWTWMDFSAALFGDKNLGFFELWQYTFTVIMTLFFFFLGSEFVIKRLEPPPPPAPAADEATELSIAEA